MGLMRAARGDEGDKSDICYSSRISFPILAKIDDIGRCHSSHLSEREQARLPVVIPAKAGIQRVRDILKKRGAGPRPSPGWRVRA